MAKKATPWKEGKIISIQTRKGIYVLAQMLKSPYLRFYKKFQEDENWGEVDARNLETLFVKGVVNTFLKFSNVSVVKDAIPDLNRKVPDTWINGFTGHRKVKVWENTDRETEIFILGSKPGGSLVKRDIYKEGKYNHPSGLFDEVILDEIPLSANEVIESNEVMSLGVYPLTNERLYQCYKSGGNVDPSKDLMFNRLIPKEFEVAILIMSGGGNKGKKEEILNTYFQ